MTVGSIERRFCPAPARLTSDAHHPFLEAACAAAEDAARHGGELLLDLSRVESADAAGLGLLVMVHRRARALGTTVLLADAPPHLERLLHRAGLDRLFRQARAS